MSHTISWISSPVDWNEGPHDPSSKALCHQDASDSMNVQADMGPGCLHKGHFLAFASHHIHTNAGNSMKEIKVLWFKTKNWKKKIV